MPHSGRPAQEAAVPTSDRFDRPPDPDAYCPRGGKPFLRASLSTTATKSLMRGSFLPLT